MGSERCGGEGWGGRRGSHGSDASVTERESRIRCQCHREGVTECSFTSIHTLPAKHINQTPAPQNRDSLPSRMFSRSTIRSRSEPRDDRRDDRRNSLAPPFATTRRPRLTLVNCEGGGEAGLCLYRGHFLLEWIVYTTRSSLSHRRRMESL